MTAEPLLGDRADDDLRTPLVRRPEPFDDFYRRQIRQLVGLAYALSGSGLASEDIAQDAMLAAYKRWDEVSRLDSPEAWVRRVVANQAVSAIRRRVAEAKGLVRFAVYRDPVAAPELPADTEWVWAQVRRLPRRQAQVVALYFYDELTMPEIATVLGISKDSVNTHLRRAREGLARRIGERSQ